MTGKGVFSYTYTWKSWHLVGFEPTLFGRAKVQPHYVYQSIAKTHMVYIWPAKVYFLIPTPEKAGTCWDLNPHCLGGRRCNHITRISPLAKYPKFGGVTAICRGSMTGKVLTRQLNGKNWERVGFEHTAIEYRESYATLCAIMLTPSTPSFMSLLPSIALPIQGKYWNKPWKTLRTGWIWTNARRIT